MSEPVTDDWDDHWDRYEESASANPAQSYRRRRIFSLIEADSPPERLLDIGSGQGDLLAEAARRWPDARLAGLELSESGVRIARRKIPGATVVQRDLLQSAPPDPALARWATQAVCSEVLEHVEDPMALLRSAGEFMAPGCRLVVTVPGGPMSAFDRHIGHRIHYTDETLRDVLEAAGLRVDRIYRAGFPFFNLYRRMVMIRGERLIADADETDGERLPLAARVAMGVFDVAFRLNVVDSRWGVQLVAVGRVPTRPSPG